MRIDTYEVTVGQFRRFVQDVVDGWTPAAGSGKHSHLNGGSGLTNSGGSGVYESGWDTSWNAELPDTAGGWDTALGCHAAATWTATAGANESLPINCVHWYDAYAYCIWSGGFLPSEAERNYVASGGDAQRSYPWGEDAANANLLVYNTSGPAAVGTKPMGEGRWGHANLAGNVDEWTLDFYVDPYADPCTDCAQLDPGAPVNRVKRGAHFYTSGSGSLRTGARFYQLPDWRTSGSGIRCARAPLD